jgi:hypothetical protein
LAALKDSIERERAHLVTVLLLQLPLPVLTMLEYPTL